LKYTGASFNTWGWRIPFLLSFVLVIVGLYVRLGVEEPPVFLKAREENRVSQSPVLEVIKTYPLKIALVALSRLADQVPFYIAATFMVSYGTAQLGIQRSVLVEGSMAMAAVGMVTLPIFAHLSDRFSRKLIFKIGCLFPILYAFPFFMLVKTRIPAVVISAIAIVHVGVSLTYGPATALYTENFPTRLRFSGSSLGYQLATIIGGGLAPLISVFLFHEFHSTAPISIYMVLAGVIAFFAASGLTERSGQEIDS
jgi:MFS family permease